MGAWGYEIFDSDSNMDTWADIESGDPVQIILDTFEEYCGEPPLEYLEIDQTGYLQISAVLVVAFEKYEKISEQPKERINAYMEEKIHKLVKQNQDKYDSKKDTLVHGLTLKQAARKSLDLVCSGAATSEPYGLFEEAGELEKWLASMEYVYKALDELTIDQ